MGICALCCQQPPTDSVTESKLSKRNKKVRPLLMQLEKDFAEHAGEDKHLDMEELSQMWVNVAVKKQGKLSPEEEQLIRSTAREFFETLDMDKNGTVTYAEFVAHSMGGLEERGELRDMRSKMEAQMKKDPSKLNELVEKFKAWDKNGDGYVSLEEMEEHLLELQKLADESGENQDKNIAAARKLKEELLEAADVDGDGKVDLWEAIAWALGRRRVPVEIILYDISKGATDWLGPLLLGRTDVEAFHSAVLVYGSEYWYGGKVFRSDPPCEKQFGKPMTQSAKLTLEPSVYKPEIHVVRAGYTFVTHDEFVEFLKNKIIDRYTGLHQYDLLTHSCNHFSDEVMHFLTGHGVPDHVLALQKMALTPTVKAMRPYLNKYLGGFSQEVGGGDQLMQDLEAKREANAQKANISDVLGEGETVVVEGVPGMDVDGPVVATVLKEEGGKIDIKYFDADSGEVKTLSGIDKKVIQRKLSS